jgi:hypothetical protein
MKVGFDSESAIEVPSDNDNNPKPGRDDLKFDDDDDDDDDDYRTKMDHTGL